MDPAATPDIFISHSTKDDPEVDRIAEALRAAGLSVWVDHQNGIPIGTPSFDQMIQENLNKCRRGLFVLTGNSADNPNCNGEWRHLLTQKKLLYVARLTDFPQSAFPSRLSIIQYANLLQDYSKGLEALIQALKENTALDPAHPGTALVLRRSGQFPGGKLDLPLIGREAGLTAVSRLLGGAGVVVLTGPGGVGKTRLAAELATLAANDDGVIWHTLAPAATPAEAEQDLARLTSLIREHFPSALAAEFEPDAIWAMLGKSQALLVLDNAEDCQYPAPFIRQLQKMHTDGAKRGVLLTSRHFWPGLTAREHPVLIPSPPDGERIMQSMLDFYLPTQQVRPVAAEVAALAAAARYHPRLMEFGATWSKRYPTAQVETWLRTLRGGKKPEEALADVLGHTLDLMARDADGPAALAALRRVLPCRSGFTYAAYLALTADQPDAVDALDTLLAWNLLRRDSDERYETELLTRETQAADPAAFSLHYGYYLALAKEHDERQDYAGLAPDAGNLEAAFEWALGVGKVEDAYLMANLAGEMLRNRGRFAEELVWLQRVEAVLPVSADKKLLGALANSLGISFTAQPLGSREANLDQAIKAFRTALKYRTEVATPQAFAMTQNNLGATYRTLSVVREMETNLGQAIKAFEAALKYRTEVAAPLDFAKTQINLGATYRDLSIVREREANLGRAINAYKAALKYLTETASPQNFAMTQHNLGIAYSDLGGVWEREANLGRAINAFEAALKYHTEVAAPLDFAMTQHNLGSAYRNLSELREREVNLDRAINAYEAALKYRTEVAAPQAFAMTQNNLGNAYWNLSEVREREANLGRAINAYETALKYRTEAAAPQAFAMTQNNLGTVYRGLSEVREREANLGRAIVSYQTAMRVSATNNFNYLYNISASNLGVVLKIIGDVPGPITQ